jgi:hypothetical protein
MTPFTVVSRSHFWWLPLTLLSLHSSYCWQWTSVSLCICCQFGSAAILACSLSIVQCMLLLDIYWIFVYRFVKKQAVRTNQWNNTIYSFGEAKSVPQCNLFHSRNCHVPAMSNIFRYQVLLSIPILHFFW